MVTKIWKSPYVTQASFLDTTIPNEHETHLTWSEKLARVRSGAAPRVLDLFSGCGGISLGFQRAGFEIVGSVELDEFAARSHAVNFHGNTADNVRMHGVSRDITKIEPEHVLRALYQLPMSIPH